MASPAGSGKKKVGVDEEYSCSPNPPSAFPIYRPIPRRVSGIATRGGADKVVVDEEYSCSPNPQPAFPIYRPIPRRVSGIVTTGGADKVGVEEKYTSPIPPPAFPIYRPTPRRVSGIVTRGGAEIGFNYGEHVVLERGQGVPLLVCNKEVVSLVGGGLTPKAESTNCYDKAEVPPKDQP